MVRILFRLASVLALACIPLAASDALAGHRAGLFGKTVVKSKAKVRTVERGAVFQHQPVRAIARGIVGGGCVGTVRGAGCAGVTVGAGCSGWVGPALPVPPVGPVPAPMPKR